MNRIAHLLGCDHEWLVVSTALCEGCLILQCRKCDATNAVDSPTPGEWREAFHAPSYPYPWTDTTRLRHQ